MQGWKSTWTENIQADFFIQRMTMNVNEIADGWYWSHLHGEGGSHGGYLATSRRAVLIDDDDRGLGVGSVTPKTAC